MIAWQEYIESLEGTFTMTVSHTIIQKFVCLKFIFPIENVSLVWRRHYYRSRAANSDLCSALMVIAQWGFFSVPHLRWHVASVYYGHLRGPVTLAPKTERLAVELTISVFTTDVCSHWDSNTRSNTRSIHFLCKTILHVCMNLSLDTFTRLNFLINSPRMFNLILECNKTVN